MFRGCAGVMLIVVCLAVHAQAEEPERREVYTIRPWVDGAIITTGALASIIPWALSDEIVTVRCPCQLEELPSLDRHAVGNNNNTVRAVSDVTLGFSIAAPLLVDYFDIGWNRTLLDDTIVFAEALAVTGAVTTMFKYTTQRPLPLLYANTPGQSFTRGENYLAFYSGHVSVTFTMLSVMAMTLNLRHGFSIWPWVAVTVVGTSVAAERVIAGQHFFTDVIVGAFMGTAVGVLVPWFHKRRDWGAPVVSGNSGAVTIGWQREW